MTTSNGNGNGQRHGATDEKVNISTDPISPKSKKVYVSGTIHPDNRVPFREISLSTSTPVSSLNLAASEIETSRPKMIL